MNWIEVITISIVLGIVLVGTILCIQGVTTMSIVLDNMSIV